jgi:hypothetical protein
MLPGRQPKIDCERGWCCSIQLAAYNGAVISRGIREYMSRDWAAIRDSKDRYWAERISRYGPGEAFRIAEELRRQALLRDPTWPTPELRQADLDTHVRLVELLRRADSARRR